MKNARLLATFLAALLLAQVTAPHAADAEAIDRRLPLG